MNYNFRSTFRILKGGKVSLVVSAFLAGLATCAVASPSGGVVTGGSVTISQNGTTTNITQSTQKGSINWNNFSIAGNETVNFNQPNVNSITLNRVIGNERSIIDGALNANGQVWILNSNGILFNSSAKINTAGILATTKNITDTDFQAGNYKFTGESTQSIINLGTIQASDSGYVSLLANSVSNDGTIKAYKGTVHLTGASEATININGNSIVSLTVNKGVLDALIENKNIIQADGGKIYLTTNAVDEILKGVVNNTGIIEAKSLDDVSSEVILFAHGGTANVSGEIKAEGGFVETSGQNLKVADNTIIKAKTWLLDPTDITITNVGTDAIGGSSISGATINTSLNNGTSVLLEATNDITINDDISKTAGTDATLTFKAGNNISLASSKTISSSSNKLNLVLWADSDNTTQGGIVLNFNSVITTNGGHLWMGGGSGSTTWNGLSVGNSYARGTGGVGSSGIFFNGLSTNRILINTFGGDIKMYGYGSSLGGAGIFFNYTDVSGNFLDLRGDGYYGMSAGGNGMGIRLDGSTLVGGANGISINAKASVNNTGQWSFPMFFNNASSAIYATDGGDITIALQSPYGSGNNKYMSDDFGGSKIGDESLQSGDISISMTGTSIAEINLVNILTSGNFSLNASGSSTRTIAQRSDAKMVIGGMTTFIGKSNANITLSNIDNDFFGSLALNTANNVALLDKENLTLGVFANIAGTVSIATLVGNLTINGNISTTNTTSSAIILNAGKSTASGTSTGGDIIYTSGTISTGTNGRATLYTGSVANSIGLSNLINSGNFRYDSDETTTNYITALGSGKYALYRERPIITVTADNKSKTYDGLGYFGANSITTSGYVNNDTSAILSGSINYLINGGNLAINAGTYTISPSGYTNALGYGINFVDGTLTIDKANATLIANSDTKIYNGQAQSVSGFSAIGLVNNETIAVLDGVSGDSVTGIDVGTYNTALAATDDNYNLSFINGTLHIIPNPQPQLNPQPEPIQVPSNIIENILATPVQPTTPKTFVLEDLPILEALELSISNEMMVNTQGIELESNQIQEPMQEQKTQEQKSQPQEQIQEIIQNTLNTTMNEIQIVQPNPTQSVVQITQINESNTPNTIQEIHTQSTLSPIIEPVQSLQPPKNQNQGVNNFLVAQELKQSIESYENQLQTQGLNKSQSQTITNAMLKTSIINPNDTTITAKTMIQAMQIDKNSIAASLASGVVENKGGLFHQTLQNLLAKGVDPKEAYKSAIEASNIQLPSQISIAKRFASMTDAQAKLAMNFLAKGYGEKEAYELAQKIQEPKESQKSKIISGDIPTQLQYLGSYLEKYSLDDAIKLALQTNNLKQKYEKIDANNVELSLNKNIKAGVVPNSLVFEKALANELRKNSFIVAYQNALQIVQKTKQHQQSPLENLAKGELSKQLSNQEKIWWIEFTKQILNNKTQKEAKMLADNQKQRYLTKIQLVQQIEQKNQKGKK